MAFAFELPPRIVASKLKPIPSSGVLAPCLMGLYEVEIWFHEKTVNMVSINRRYEQQLAVLTPNEHNSSVDATAIKCSLCSHPRRTPRLLNQVLSNTQVHRL